MTPRHSSAIAVHQQHDAQYRAQIAEVGQQVGRNVLIYTARLRHVDLSSAAHSGQDMATMQDKQTWSGRFNEPVAELVKRYTASVDFDKRLALFDIQGSLAHAQMLASCNIISAQDLKDIQRGLAQIENEIISGDFVWQLDLEDVHLNIEKRLTTLVGDAGKRLHTGRSRNDQVATDIRLYLRHAIDDIIMLHQGSANCAARSGTASHAHHHAGLHPSASGAAGELCASPDGLFRDAASAMWNASAMRAAA